jgi:hypothetical protein
VSGDSDLEGNKKNKRKYNRTWNKHTNHNKT